MREASHRPAAGHARAATIARPRIAALLSGAFDRRLTLVCAGAGYGKTTALAQLAELGECRWVTLRPADVQAESLATRIATALGQPIAPESAIAAATGSDDRVALAERRAASLCAIAELLGQDVLLILDGLEHLGHDETSAHLLRILALEAPRPLHLALCGRTLPELRMGGAQGRGEVLEIAAPDLSFTTAETAELLNAGLGDSGAELAAECRSLTGGWAAALRLLVDRLSRLERAEQERTVARLRGGHGQLWQAFARDLLAGEDASACRVLELAGLLPQLDAGLAAALGIDCTERELHDLHERGLLVDAGEPGRYSLSPVLTGVAADGSAQAQTIRERAADWLEERGRLPDALECHARGAASPAQQFLRRRGPDLVRGGGAARVIEVLRHHPSSADPALDAVLAEALQAVGDWDAALDLFARVQHAAGPDGPPAAVAWRFGVLQYLRGQAAAAAGTLRCAHDPAGVSVDDAMVSAWLSTTLWSQGDVDGAEDCAATALRQAAASADACALAAAHVALALAAASRGERDRNEQEYRLALAAARDGGDIVQIARIHANLSSRAMESGAYAEAVAEADRALEAGAGHRFFSALALSNKAESQLRLGLLDDAAGSSAEAAAMYAELGSLHASVPHVIFGELYWQRGDLVRARSSFERACVLARQSDDPHTLVPALTGLARIHAGDDIAAARSAAASAIDVASGLELAGALCGAAEVELWAGQLDAAQDFARRAEKQARETADRGALAGSLELLAACHVPPDSALLRAAVQVWTDIGNPIGAGRARLAIALADADELAVEAAERELATLGVAPRLGVTAVMAAARRAGAGVAIVALGRFTVVRDGEPVPPAAWQSRKARDLLKLLVARAGRPITREAAAEQLWPDEKPEPLANRLSVALSTVRKVIDPDRQHPADYFVDADAHSIALRPERVSIDLVEFRRATERGSDLAAAGDPAAEAVLRRARAIYAGDLLEEDPYADWAVEPREDARSRLITVLRLLARMCTERGDDESAGQLLAQLLERDPYDEDAWLALVGGQLRLRRHGEARRRYAAYARRMAELDVGPVPLADAAGRRP